MNWQPKFFSWSPAGSRMEKLISSPVPITVIIDPSPKTIELGANKIE